MKTKRKIPKEPGITIRFESKAQIALIKRAAIHMDMSVNSFVRAAAEASAKWMLARGKADIFVDSGRNTRSIPKEQNAG